MKTSALVLSLLALLATSACHDGKSLHDRLTEQPAPSAGFPSGYQPGTVRDFRTISGVGNGVSVELKDGARLAGVVYALFSDAAAARRTFAANPDVGIVARPGPTVALRPQAVQTAPGEEARCFLYTTTDAPPGREYAECDLLVGTVIVVGTATSTGPAGSADAATALAFARAGAVRVRELISGA